MKSLFVKFFSVWICLQVTATVICHAEVRTNMKSFQTGDLPEEPVGYESKNATIAAIGLGKEPIVNLAIPAPDSVQVINDQEYSRPDGHSLGLDWYIPKLSEKSETLRPVVVLIHGGAWSKGSRKDYYYYCIRLAEAGYVTASVSYRLSKTAPFPAAVVDVKAAIRFIRSESHKYQADPEKLAVLGGSAGGHLALMTGFSSDKKEWEQGPALDWSSRPQAVIDIYGPYDLTTDFAKNNSAVTGFLRAQYDTNPDVFLSASPKKHLTQTAPPVLILHGTVDEVVPIAQSDALASQLEELEIPYVYGRLKGWPHTMDLAKRVNEYSLNMTLRFLEATLR